VAVSRNKPFQQAISHMTGGHGAWGSVVVDDQGQIALNAEYAVVAAANHFDVLAWTCPSLDAAQLVADLTGEYGVYDWSGLEDQGPVYNQHIVQPKRLRQYTSLRKQGKLAYKSSAACLPGRSGEVIWCSGVAAATERQPRGAPN
jgi:ParB family chromosome partitioning protein